MSKENVEYRYLDIDVAECRILEEENKRFLEGHAAVFGQKSKLIFEDGRLFNEVIAPTAFDKVLQDERLDVPMTYNHNRGQLLGRTKSNTLKLSKDEKGLAFRVEIPNTATGNEVYELVKRGDLYENSFGFVVTRDDQEWTKDEEGNHIRTITNVQRLADVAVCINGAYANTDVAARSLDEIVQIEDKEEVVEEQVEVPEEVEENSTDPDVDTISRELELLQMRSTELSGSHRTNIHQNISSACCRLRHQTNKERSRFVLLIVFIVGVRIVRSRNTFPVTISIMAELVRTIRSVVIIIPVESGNGTPINNDIRRCLTRRFYYTNTLFLW